MKNRILPLVFCYSTMVLSAFAHAGEPEWLKCHSLPEERQLNCYQTVTDQYLAKPIETAKQQTTPAECKKCDKPQPKKSRLDQLWTKPGESSDTSTLGSFILPYKQNYLLVLGSIHHPSEAPTSPNPLNNVPPGNMPSSTEIKFQLSYKAPLPLPLPDDHSVWLAYTQQSHWQAYNSVSSRPFRENNYEPELIYHWSGIKDIPWLELGKFKARYVNVSAVHQSNGQSLPRSRSWNRLTAQLGAEYQFDENQPDKHLAVLIRPWWRVSEKATADDTHDITKYLGFGDVEVDYWRDTHMLSALLRNRAVQLDYSFGFEGYENAWQLHLQYFNGYGESLIDYNHKIHSFGIGVSLPY